MESYNNPCVVIGSIGFHRLAQMLFDWPIHLLIKGRDDHEEVVIFQEFIKNLQVQRGGISEAEVSVVEKKPNVYVFSSSTGHLDVFGPSEISTAEFGVHPFVSIASIPIIDPNSLTNKLVGEFSQDFDSRLKLKRLRHFAHSNYENKPLSFIQEDLEIKIQDYRLTARKWGLQTIDSTLSISAADKVLSGACAGFVSTMFGLPLAEAAAVGAVAAIGATVVKVQYGKKIMEVSQTQEVVSYLVEIQDSVKKPPNKKIQRTV
jgi:hypothetical protein